MVPEPVLVHELLNKAAQLHPDRQAIWDGGAWYTYGQIEQWSNQVAGWLCDCGVQRGDRVAILLVNSKDYVAAYMGILKAGAIVVPINIAVTADGLANQLEHVQAKGLITQRRFLKVVNRALQATKAPAVIGLLETEALAGLEDQGGRHAAAIQAVYEAQPHGQIDRRCIDLDLAMIVYTSGSTGRPKGVMLSHLNLMSNTRSIVSYLGLTQEDRVLAILPFYYIYGNSLVLTHMAVGGSVVIENRFAFPQVVLETMRATGVTGIAGVPSTFMIMLDQSEFCNCRFESLRYATQAGGHMPVAIQQRVAAAIAPAKLYVMYGTTETSPRLTYLDPADLTRKAGSVGRAIPNVEVAILDDQGRPAPANQMGEVVARGSNVMVGYWQDPDGTAAVLRGGWYHTGDIGWMDEEGYLYLLGRAQDMAKVGGHRVSVLEVEDALVQIPGVRQAAVIAVEDGTLGQALEAYVAADIKVTGPAESIRQRLGQILPRFKIPRNIYICKSLPMDPSGKVLKSALQAVPTA